jgi:hypothetical protein
LKDMSAAMPSQAARGTMLAFHRAVGQCQA